MKRARMVTGIAVVAAMAAGGVGGAVLGVPGISGAQGFPSASTLATTTATSNGKAVRTSPLLDAAAKALNLTTDQLRQKLSDGKTTIADVAKQQNVDVNTVIDAMTNAERDRIGKIVNQPWPTRGPNGGPAFAPAAGGGMRFGLGRIAGAALDDVAKVLGISTDDLRTDLRNGQSIADIAKAKNVDVNKVIDALVADASTKIDQAVKDGHLTQQQADNLKSKLKTAITDAVNAKFPRFGGRGRFGPGFGPGGPGVGGPGMGGPGMWNGGSTSTTTKPAA